MILPLFITFIAISLFLLAFGYFSQSDLMRIIAVVLLFLCSTAISPAIPSLIGEVQYQTGFTETVDGNTTNTTFQYATYTSHTFSFYLIIFALLTGALIWFERKEQ